MSFKTQVELSANAESFIIKDVIDNDWTGITVAAAAIGIVSALNGTKYFNLTLPADWTSFLSDNGLEIGIAQYVSGLTGFPDEYYSITLYYNETGNPIVDVGGELLPAEVEDSYENNQGFMAYIREAARKLPLPLDVDDFDFKENRHIQYLYALLDTAELDANQAEPNRFAKKMDYVSTQLNLRGIQYGT